MVLIYDLYKFSNNKLIHTTSASNVIRSLTLVDKTLKKIITNNNDGV